MMEPLEARTVPLSGTRLVEASAGTGKTFTLTTLYLRIVMEEGLAADQILVVTFTKAAAAELRERIRARLREMEEALRARLAGDTASARGEDSVIVPLVQACVERGDPEQELERLRLALRNFDEAQISTIHGFCDRMLEENAFESGVAFGTELVKDSGLLREEVAEDFWSRYFYSGNKGFVRWVLKTSRAGRQHSVSLLTTFLGSVLEKPGMVLRPDVQPDEDLDALENAWHSARQEAAAVWSAERSLILKHLNDAASDGVLHGKLYKPEKIASEWGAQMDALLCEDGIGSEAHRHRARLFRIS
ncbi:MAG: UvrD-helicase domain-containing protein, partial [Myxococcota bacterium]